MWNNTGIFLNKKPNFSKLSLYGFELKNDVYFLSKDIMNGSLYLNIYVTERGITNFKVIDKEFNEEYTLIFDSGATGSFVGRVRSECEGILKKVGAVSK